MSQKTVKSVISGPFIWHRGGVSDTGAENDGFCRFYQNLAKPVSDPKAWQGLSAILVKNRSKITKKRQRSEAGVRTRAKPLWLWSKHLAGEGARGCLFSIKFTKFTKLLISDTREGTGLSLGDN